MSRLRLLVLALLLVALVGQPVALAQQRSTPKLPAVALLDVGRSVGGTGGYAGSGFGTSGYGVGDWADADSYQLGTDPAGNLVIGSHRRNRFRTVVVNPVTRQVVARHSVVAGAEIFGRALMGHDGFVYLLLGLRPSELGGLPMPEEKNADNHELDNTPVLRVAKYTSDLTPVAAATLTGSFAKTYSAPAAGASSMLLEGSQLVVHTSQFIYHIPGDSAPHHETSLTFSVDTNTMTAARIEGVYASHSFNQFVRRSGNDLVFLDHGDGTPRGVGMSVVRRWFDPARPTRPADCESEAPADPAACEAADLDIDRYVVRRALGEMSSSYDNYTGLTASGFEVGSSRGLTVGLSLPLGNPIDGVSGDSGRLRPNVYVASTDLATGGTTFRWLTRYSPRSKRVRVGEPRLVTLGNDRFAAVFTITTKRKKRPARTVLAYRLLDQSGGALARSRVRGLEFDNVSQPTLAGGRLLWVASVPQRLLLQWDGQKSWRRVIDRDYLYGLDVRSPAAPRALRRST